MALRPSEILRGVGRVADLASHAHTIMSIVGALSGKKPDEDAPRVVKGTYGIFGLEDERRFQILLDELERRKKGSRRVIADYLEWAFPDSDGSASEKVISHVVSVYYTNAFRTFVVRLDGDPVKTGKETVRVVHKAKGGGTTTTTTERDSWAPAQKNSLEFLRMMMAHLAPDIGEYDKLTERERESRFQELERQFKAEGVPAYPRNIEAEYRKILDKLKGFGVSAEDWSVQLNARLQNNLRDRRTRPKGFFHRLVELVSP